MARAASRILPSSKVRGALYCATKRARAAWNSPRDIVGMLRNSASCAAAKEALVACAQRGRNGARR
eukprot:9688064-Alexandrium_andersonii.AAC.1